jgi:hypothetical protein
MGSVNICFSDLYGFRTMSLRALKADKTALDGRQYHYVEEDGKRLTGPYYNERAKHIFIFPEEGEAWEAPWNVDWDSVWKS